MIRNLTVIFLGVLALCLFSVVEGMVPATLSTPKSGTHLLNKFAELLFPDAPTVYVAKYNKRDFPDANRWSIINTNSIQAAKSKHGILFLDYPWYTIEENRGLFLQHDIKAVYIIRDLRDQIVSRAYWIKKCNPEADISVGQLISAIIGREALPATVKNSRHFPKKFVVGRDFFVRFLPWMHEPNVLTVKFEDLVGSRGGGDDTQQIHTMQLIADHWGIALKEKEAKEVAGELFGDSSTFRKGCIGDWRNHFSEKDITDFKEILGDLLIDLKYEENDSW